MSGNSNKLIAFNYFGGKFTWVDQIIPYFPPHRSFVDLFCGSMAVTLNKPVSALETANDLNGDVTNFFKVLRNQPDELLTLLELTPVSRDEYNSSWDIPAGVSDLERARCFYVRVRQSMYGLGIQERNKGWHICSHNDRTRKSQSVTRWNNALQKLGPVIGRLKNLQIENRDCLQVISMMDSYSTFFYCDPPYPKESRKSFNDYRFEFPDEKHEELADALHQIKGQAMISGYDCDLMRSLYHDWEMVAFPSKNNNIRSGSVQECIWMNYDYTYGMNLFSGSNEVPLSL